MRKVVIVEAVRTAIGSFGGSLADVPAVELGAHVVREAVRRSGIDPIEVSEVIMGNVLQAGLGQNPARQAAIRGGLPESVPSYTVNKVCGSGLKAIALAVLSVAAGESEIVVAGGMENMSQAPHLLMQTRKGYRLGHGELVDSLISDGLWDAFYDIHMGITAENIAEKFRFSRTELDEFAARSQARAQSAQEEGRFQEEIVPYLVPRRKREPLTFDRDEGVKGDTTMEKLSALRPAFQSGGVVTAGNASTLNDGASAVLIMSGERAKRLGLKPMAVITSYASAGCDPRLMGLGPVPAVQATLQKAGWTMQDIDLFEMNEAFAAQALGVAVELGLPMERVNVNGGAIALGHPIGASGARIVTTLLHEMNKRDLKRGIAGLCIGGGQGMAMAFEREPQP
ncbi:acetyl-CoA C-acetyltransferase [Paenibacillus sp.]|uniref:acetyl-CoA C-acetyltransferase n=1 Tax=Paenibacillus sp. TaxID=58172 RepID=UPI002D69199E|nr:acetyl-CoA C-acetyltransferase [Paenibacillus sp.]HZG84051.1 acetyl-CoA C-acetyltransferase [Paenibacillus sp.]